MSNGNTNSTRSLFARYKWLVARRFSQLFILGLFLLGPLTDNWIVTGNLSSSLSLNVLPLTDPFILLQTFIAQQDIAKTALIGAAIVLVFYFIIGGRVYCSWVCPLNIATDIAAWARLKLNIKSSSLFHKTTRYWLFAAILSMTLITGNLAWELINPVSLVHRGIIFNLYLSASVFLSILLFDLFISREAWCGHLCPVGVFYHFVGKFSFLRISAFHRDNCDRCNDCFTVCPEEQVIRPALFGKTKKHGPVILDSNCTNCGRCIDVCDRNVFKFTHRFNKKELLKSSGDQ